MHRVGADDQLVGDLGVRPTGRNPAEDLPLALGEAIDPRVRSGGGSGAEMLDHGAGDGGSEQRAAVGDDPDGALQVGRLGVLEQEAARAVPERLERRTAGGSLIGSIVGLGGPDTAPGVLDTVSDARAAITVACYIVLAAAVSIVVVRRRDVA